VQIGHDPVHDLRDLTRILQTHHAGETVDVVVLREGCRRSFRITLRKRPRRHR